MYSEGNTADEILERILNKLPSNFPKIEGNFYYDSIAPISDELSQGYLELDDVIEKVFAITGYDIFLEMRAAEFGVYRKDGTNAKGQVTFKGSDNTLIPEGTLVQTQGGLQYKTLTDVTIINSNAIVNVEALEIGNKYNLPSETITELPVQVIGVTGVINSTEITGGTNEEDDESLRNRLLLKVRTPATSGNIGHYKLWATEVPGVGDSVVLPLWNGPGTVKVIVLDSNKKTPSKDIVDNVKSNIEKQRPIGAMVEVTGAIEVPININVKLQLASGATLEEVKTQIETGVKAYLETLAFKDPLVRYTRIANVLLDIPPVIDYSDLKVNNGTANIEVKEGEVAVLGSVVVTSA